MAEEDLLAPGGGGPGAGSPRVLAFYLPQYHPVPENDAWRGRGFTDWRTTVQARPLFPGHYQPHVPADLGFYDLRLPEAREAQARLAKSHGVSGFCWYHYWSRGRRVLDRPFAEVLRSGRPDLGFCLCWVNESWYRKWRSLSDERLLSQDYDEADDRAHIRFLIEVFEDPRYIRVKGRPLLCVYRPQSLPDARRTFAMWREECSRAGVAEPWLVKFDTYGDESDPRESGCDASAEFHPHGIDRVARPLPPPPGCHPGNLVFGYSEVAERYLRRPRPAWTRYPCVATGWDNTPRRRDGQALLLLGSDPGAYRSWLEGALARQREEEGADGLVFLNAWNEWAEGAHLEPDLRHGLGFLDATRSALGETRPPRAADPCPNPAGFEELYADLYDRFVALQAASTDYQGMADRMVARARREADEAVASAREESRRLAERVVVLERRLAAAGHAEEHLAQIEAARTGDLGGTR